MVLERDSGAVCELPNPFSVHSCGKWRVRCRGDEDAEQHFTCAAVDGTPRLLYRLSQGRKIRNEEEDSGKEKKALHSNLHGASIMPDVGPAHTLSN